MAPTPGSLIYDTNTFIQVVPNLKRSQSFLLDKFFPNLVVSDSEFVSIDVDIGIRRMAPFVSPLVEGKLVEQRRIQTNTFKPAYIKDKRAPDLRRPVRRQIGERIGGELTGQEREMMNLEFEMTDQVDMLTRRLEWMAASALPVSAKPWPPADRGLSHAIAEAPPRSGDEGQRQSGDPQAPPGAGRTAGDERGNAWHHQAER